MVARFGWIMPEPLATPPMVKLFGPLCTVTATSFGIVSVVMIACSNSCPPSAFVTIFFIAARMDGIGRLTPITPVLAISTSSGLAPITLAASADISMASENPCSPVLALAQPLLATIAFALPSNTRFEHSTTDGDLILLSVNKPATLQISFEAMMPRSRRLSPFLRISAEVAPAVKPCGEVTVPFVTKSIFSIIEHYNITRTVEAKRHLQSLLK